MCTVKLCYVIVFASKFSQHDTVSTCWTINFLFYSRSSFFLKGHVQTDLVSLLSNKVRRMCFLYLWCFVESLFLILTNIHNAVAKIVIQYCNKSCNYHLKIMLLLCYQITCLPNANAYKATHSYADKVTLTGFRFTVQACWAQHIVDRGSILLYAYERILHII